MSPQSSSPSHFQPRGLQRVLLHWNSSRGQRLPTDPREKYGKKVTSAAARLQHLQHVSCGVSLLPPLSHSSSSLPSKQSASASQCHRSGMQWPFLHWYWSLSHFTSQPFYGNAGNCALAPRATVARGGKKDARYLVRSVSTVVVAVTLPAAGDATAVRAGKLALRTLARHWRQRGTVKETESRASARGGEGGKKQGEV